MTGRTFPLAFDGSAGHLTLPERTAIRTGLVICRSWGFDELCTRKFLRHLADALAADGLPSLRFDYPGTVDSIDPAGGTRFASWVDAAMAACDRLKREAGCDSVILFGLGPGALVAERVARRRDDVAGLALAAPATSGRRFLRETELRARVIVEGLGLSAESLPADAVTIGGLPLAPGVASDLRRALIDPLGLQRHVECLFVCRDAVAADAELAGRFETEGHAVTRLGFRGYEKLMEDPTASAVPRDVVEGIVAWATRIALGGSGSAISPPAPAAPARLAGDGFVEDGVMFRPEAPLYGILCRPAVSAAGHPQVVVFLNSGYDHHGGWARCWVNAARMLARRGIASLRFDLANIGDSPAVAGAADQVLYTEGPMRDVSAALDYLEQACPGEVVLVGRCSGAFTAFHAGYRDARVRKLGLVNQARLIWNPAESLVDVSRMVPRPASEYKQKMGDIRTLKRLAAGEIDVRSALRGLAKHAAARLSHALAPLFPNLTRYSRFRAECHRMMETLDRRGVDVAFLSGNRDESLEQLALYFGGDHSGLCRFPGVSLDILEDTDHNLTPAPAQLALRQWLEVLVTGSSQPDAREGEDEGGDKGGDEEDSIPPAAPAVAQR